MRFQSFARFYKAFFKNTPDDSTIADLESKLANIISLNQHQQLETLSAQAIISNGKYLDQSKIENLLKKVLIDNASLNHKVNKLLSDK